MFRRITSGTVNKKLFHLFREFIAKGTFPKECFLCLVILNSIGKLSSLSKDFLAGLMDLHCPWLETLSEEEVFSKKKDIRKVSDIRQINSAPFLVCNFYVSVPLSWDKQRFQKTPPSLNLLRRVETLGVLAFLFRQVCRNTIPRVSTRDLRWDFVLAEVFYSDSLSDFEQNVSGNCLKTSQHACQSCFLLVWSYILRK